MGAVLSDAEAFEIVGGKFGLTPREVVTLLSGASAGARNKEEALRLARISLSGTSGTYTANIHNGAFTDTKLLLTGREMDRLAGALASATLETD